MIETLVGFAAFLALAFLRVPMAFAMGIVGFAGVAYKLNFNVASAMIAQVTYETGLSYTLSVIPLFILMGNFVVRAKLSDELYHAAYCFLGHRRGGLAMSTVVACAGFGAICGSSIATAATFTKVSYPSMRKYGYSDALSAGAIAARRHARHPDSAVGHHGDLRHHDRDRASASCSSPASFPGSSPRFCCALPCSGSPGATLRPARRPNRIRGRSACNRSSTSGRWWCCSCW